jgi:capsular polysaccharide biosynthesis protein
MKIVEYLNLTADEIIKRYGTLGIKIGAKEWNHDLQSKALCCQNVEKLQFLRPQNIQRFILEIDSALVVGGTQCIIDWSSQTLIHHPLIDWTYEKIDYWKKLYDLEVPSSAAAIPGKTLILDGTWSLPFFHFMSETLGKIYSCSLIHELKKFDQIYLSSSQRSYVDQWSNILNLQFMKLPDAPILCEKLIIPSHVQQCGYFSKDLREYLYFKISPHISRRNEETPPKIYISRQGNRKVLNESEIVKTLSINGFVSITLENYSVELQAKLFQQAEIIVAPHGAGLTNLIFSKNKNLRLLELFGKDYQNECYASLCREMGFIYYYHVSDKGDAYGNYEVSSEVISKFIDEVTQK